MNSNNIFNVNFAKLVLDITPQKLHKPKLLAWLNTYISSLVNVYNNLIKFRKSIKYQLGVTPQVASLERMLNDKFDFTARGIYIIDGVDKPVVYLFRRIENKPVYFFLRSENKPIKMFTRGESGALTNDFIVMVPMPILFDFSEMASLIRTYKLIGTKFKIQRF